MNGMATPSLPDIAVDFEPLPFVSQLQASVKETEENQNDPFFESVLQVLLSLGSDVDDDGEGKTQCQLTPVLPMWPGLEGIHIPATFDSSESDDVFTPDDQRIVTGRPQSFSPVRSEVGHKRLWLNPPESSHLPHVKKKCLTTTRRDAVSLLREEARCLEATLHNLHVQQEQNSPSPPRKAEPSCAPTSESGDPDALVRSYAENIRLKRAIEEQEKQIRALRAKTRGFLAL